MLDWARSFFFDRLFGFSTTSVTKMNEAKPESTDRQIKRLEVKIGMLTAMSIAQTAMLAVLLVWSLIPSTSTLVVAAMLGVAFIAVFHKYIPTWAAWAFRAIGGMMGKDSVADSSTKESPLS